MHDCNVREQKVDDDDGSFGRRKDKKVVTTLTGRSETSNSGRKSAKIEVNECPETRYNLTHSLVYNHLKEISPKLAAEFSASHKWSHSSLNLQEVVDSHALRNCKQMNITAKKKNDTKKKVNVQTGGRRIRFTLKEDNIIRSAMNEAEASGKPVDKRALGRKINRSSG